MEENVVTQSGCDGRIKCIIVCAHGNRDTGNQGEGEQIILHLERERVESWELMSTTKLLKKACSKKIIRTSSDYVSKTLGWLNNILGGTR